MNDTPVISKSAWNNAKKRFAKNHKETVNYDLCKRLFVDFQEIHPKVKYRTDFEVFIKESKMEDFVFEKGEIINVSTIHKAKGKEFDNVFLLLVDFDAYSDDKKRQLYVAMTRAKSRLIIHTNTPIFNDIHVFGMMSYKDSNKYEEPESLVYHLTHHDIQLGYFSYIQHRINQLYSGQQLIVGDDELHNSQGEIILKFSKHFIDTKKSKLEERGYQLKGAKIRFILFWEDKGNEMEAKEVKIVLADLGFEKEANRIC